MGQMAGDGEHEIVVLGVIVSTLEPSARQNCASRSTAAGRCRAAALGCTSDDEELGEAGIGSGLLGAGHRVAGDEMHTFREVRGDVAHDRRLDRADIGDGGAGALMRARCRRDVAAGANRHAEDDEIGVVDRRGLVSMTLSARPSSTRLRARRRRAAVATICSASALRAGGAGDRGADQADADQGHALESRGAHVLPSLRHELGERGDNRRLASSVPMVMPQRIRQPVGRRRGAISGRGGQEIICLLGAVRPESSGKCISTKLATLGVTLSPSSGISIVQPGKPALIMGARGSRHARFALSRPSRRRLRVR